MCHGEREISFVFGKDLCIEEWFILFEDGKFRSHDITADDLHDPNSPKPPPEWDKLE